MNVNVPHVRMEEVTSVLTPAPGVSVEQALADADLSGYEALRIEDGVAYITWFKEKA